MRKLTLSADEETIRQAKRLAVEEKTSISALFANLIRLLSRTRKAAPAVPADSIAAQAAGFIELPKGRSAREVLTDALIEKYGDQR